MGSSYRSYFGLCIRRVGPGLLRAFDFRRPLRSPKQADARRFCRHPQRRCAEIDSKFLVSGLWRFTLSSLAATQF